MPRLDYRQFDLTHGDPPCSIVDFNGFKEVGTPGDLVLAVLELADWLKAALIESRHTEGRHGRSASWAGVLVGLDEFLDLSKLFRRHHHVLAGDKHGIEP